MLKKIARSKAVYLVKEMIRCYFADGIAKSAAELAYFLLFSVFPLLMFLNSALAMIHISPESLDMLTQLLPLEVRQLIQSYLTYISSVAALSPLLIGIGLTLYFLSRSVNSLIYTINRIYHIHDRRSGMMQMVVSLSFTAGFMAAIILSFMLLVVGQILIGFLMNVFHMPEHITHIWHYGRYTLTICFIFIFLLMLNYIVPNFKIRMRDAIPGALFSLVAWVGFSLAFSYYVENMARYSLLYGSLGAIMVLMLWLYLTGIIMLMGAQLNHILLQMKIKKQRGEDLS